jgi:prepilin-type N-terminal cleavage/methylation domain-containing protein
MKLISPTKTNHSGFTIVELLITITLIAISVPAIALMIDAIGGVNDRARDLASIHALVERKVETLRSIGFTGLANGTTTFTSELPTSVAEPRSATYTISSLNAGVKLVSVTVTYYDHGKTQSLAYKTYIGELGVGQY